MPREGVRGAAILRSGVFEHLCVDAEALPQSQPAISCSQRVGIEPAGPTQSSPGTLRRERPDIEMLGRLSTIRSASGGARRPGG